MAVTFLREERRAKLTSFSQKQETIMLSSMKWILAFGAGVVGGWAIRSLSDSPEGAGVKLLEVGLKAKDRMESWAAVERERLDDMVAEARSNIARAEAMNPPGHHGKAGSKRGTHVVMREGEHSESIV
jgi:hypothetical protein